MKWPPQTKQSEGIYTLFDVFFVENEVANEEENGKLEEELVGPIYHTDEQEMRKGPDGDVLINGRSFANRRDGIRKSRSFDEILQEAQTKQFTASEVGISTDRELVALLEKHNRPELLRAWTALERWRDELNQLPQSQDLQLQVKYHEGVLGKFIEWYDSKDLEPPSAVRKERTSPKPSSGFQEIALSDEDVQRKPSVSSTKKRLILPPNDAEKLNEAIFSKVQSYIDSGKGTMEQSFECASRESETLFGIELTRGQIEGRYKRERRRSQIFRRP